MTDAGILLGLPRQVAHDLIVQTAIGSAIMLRDSGEHPVKLREAVTSPAGTTISAIRELENHGYARRCSRPWRPPATGPVSWPHRTSESIHSRLGDFPERPSVFTLSHHRSTTGAFPRPVDGPVAGRVCGRRRHVSGPVAFTLCDSK